MIKCDINTAVRDIKEQPDKDIAVYGGAQLLSSLLDGNLVDEITMTIIPVILGKSKPMADALKQRVYLTIIDTKKFSSGSVHLSYTVKKR